VANATSPAGETRAALLVPVQEAPAVVSSSFDYLTAPHRLSFQFSKNVSGTLSTSDLALKNLTTSQSMSTADITLSYDSSNNTATFTFPGLPRMLLPDGRYQATLLASGIQDASNVPLDGNGDGTGGDDAIFNFFQLTGDADHDGDVDTADFERLLANMDKPGDFSQGDFDYSGTVTFADFQTFELMFGQSLPAMTSSSGTLATVKPVANTSPSPRQRVSLSRPVFAAPTRKTRGNIQRRLDVLQDSR